MTVIGYANLDQYRPAKAQAADLAVLRDTSDVTAVVEWSRLSQQRFWSDLPILSSCSIRSAWNSRGHRIRARRFRAIKVHPTGLPEFWVVVAHMPPKRMWGPLYWAYARRLRGFVRDLGGEKVVWGDWNKRTRRDPARLRRTFGGVWYGSRIDGCWVSRGLVKHIAAYREVPQPERNDRHPFCYLTLKETL